MLYPLQVSPKTVMDLQPGYLHNVLLPLLQQCAVLSDLLLQPGLDAQQHLVLLVLALHLAADAGQLLLYGVNLPLDLLQQAAVARFGFCQGVLQRVFLGEERQEGSTGALRPLPDEGASRPRASRPRAALPQYRAELRLQFDLQVLHFASQFRELVAACLDVLAAGSDLPVDFFDLQEQSTKHTGS